MNKKQSKKRKAEYGARWCTLEKRTRLGVMYGGLGAQMQNLKRVKPEGIRALHDQQCRAAIVDKVIRQHLEHKDSLMQRIHDETARILEK